MQPRVAGSPRDEVTSYPMSGVISAMSDVLKIVKGRPEGHAIRSCFIGMRILQELRLTPALRTIISQS